MRWRFGLPIFLRTPVFARFDAQAGNHPDVPKPLGRQAVTLHEVMNALAIYAEQLGRLGNSMHQPSLYTRLWVVNGWPENIFSIGY